MTSSNREAFRELSGSRVIIFVVTPPGAAASNIKPTFNSTGIGNTKANNKANIGKRITCERTPTKKSFG